MDRKTALSAASALAMTTAAGVLALTATVGQSASSSPGPTPTEIVTEYQVVQVSPDQTITTTTVAPTARTVYEIEYDDHRGDEHEQDDDD